MAYSELAWQSVDGVNFFGREWKPESNLNGVVILVHGLGEHTGRYQHVGKALNEAGFILTGFDLRGHGKTSGTRGHIPSFDIAKDDIQAFIEKNQKCYPGYPIFLYGHSLGGNLALHFAFTRKFPIAGMIVTAPGLKPAGDISMLKMIAAKILYKLTPGFTLANGLDFDGLSRDPKIKQDYLSDPLVHPMISARLGLDMINSGSWLQTQQGPLSYPILLQQGSADRLVNPLVNRQFAKNLKGDVTYREWEGKYHELHNEPEKDQVLGVMIEWLCLHSNHKG